MADEVRKQFHLRELTRVLEQLADLQPRCVLIGGQAVYYWAEKYFTFDEALPQFARLSPFVSKDLDFQGSTLAARELGRRLECPVDVPSFREAFGNLLSGKMRSFASGHPLDVEVLQSVPGFTVGNFDRFVIEEHRGNLRLLVLDAVAMLQAKARNVVHIHKEGRRDREQFYILVAWVRAYLRMLLRLVRAGELPMRGLLSTVERVLTFTEKPAGRAAAEAPGLRWGLILPQPELETATEPELVALPERRLPVWHVKIARQKPLTPASALHVKLLAILAETARSKPTVGMPRAATPAQR